MAFLKNFFLLLVVPFFFVSSLSAGQSQSKLIEKKIAVLVPSFNNQDWYKQNLDSIFAQEYENFFIIYIDDYSSDGTGDLVEKYIQENGWENRVIFIRNESRNYALGNRYKGVHLCDNDTIVIDCDGDDMLAHPRVLSTINEIYSTKDVWMTWGSYINQSDGSPGCSQRIPPSVFEKNSFREHTWASSHLRTYYAALFKKIKYEDLLYEGQFIRSATDLAVMFPMLEMASSHARFVNKTLYIYNEMNPLNLRKVNHEFQILMEATIRKKTKYEKLDSLFVE